MLKIKSKFINLLNVHKDLLLLLIIGGLYSIGLFLSNTFVNIYLWRQTENYVTIASYNLFIYIFQSITFVIAGRLAKKIDRVVVLRVGLGFLSFFFLTVLMLGNTSANVAQLLGALLGIGYGFYWLAFNVLTFEITEPDTRIIFNGVLGTLQSFAGMTAPFLAGIIISKQATNIGYMTIFTISFSLFVLAIGCSFFLKKRKNELTYHLLTVFYEIKKDRRFRNVLFANAFQGMREGVFLFVVAILIFLVTSSEFALGTFSLILNGASFIFYLFVTKFLQPELRMKAIFIGSFIMSFAVWIFLTDFTYMRLLLYAVVVGTAYPIVFVPFRSLTYDVIGVGHDARRLRIEFIVVLEIFIHLGRMIAVTTFIVFHYFLNELLTISLVLALFSLSYFVSYLWIRNVRV